MKSAHKVKFMPYAAFSVAGVFLLSGMLYFAPDLPSIPAFTAPPSGVNFLPDSELSADNRDIISIYDDAPVFLVTPLNYAGFLCDMPSPSIPAESASGSPRSMMSDVRQMYSTPDVSFSIMEGLSDAYKFSNFMNNSAAAKIDSSTESSAKLGVVSSDTGKTVFTKSFKPSAVPAGRMWTPVEMSVVVAPDASWSAPALVTSSGYDDLDAELENFVRNCLHEMKLRNGYYIITLSP